MAEPHGQELEKLTRFLSCSASPPGSAGEQKLYFMAADGSNECAVPLPKVGTLSLSVRLNLPCRLFQELFWCRFCSILYPSKGRRGEREARGANLCPVRLLLSLAGPRRRQR